MSLAILRIDRVELGTNSPIVYFGTIAGLLYQVESATNAASMDWTPVSPAQAGTGAAMSVSDPVRTTHPQRLYPLSVSP